jgi:hypothetical protein
LLSEQVKEVSSMKTKRAMKEYTCAECKGTIRKGDHYARKQVTIGRRGDEWTENVNGYPTVVQNWLTYDARLCNECANGK